jgi:negative regulator of flagellin synthesis FlgM
MPIKPQPRSRAHVEVSSPTSPDIAEKVNDAPARAPGRSAPTRNGAHISSARQQLSARTDHTSGLLPERAAQVRQRMLSGAYDSLAVADTVARRIIARGDRW